jgi:hypothetical protein
MGKQKKPKENGVEKLASSRLSASKNIPIKLVGLTTFWGAVIRT